jgi:serine-type anaerobic sulfatase-maturating enzyme
VVFSWQGGEPTLLGLEFFEKVVELEQEYQNPFQRMENDLRTNGTLLDDDWGAFLKKHDFMAELNIDGPKELHDRFRVTNDGKPTFDKVFAAAQMLHRHGVPFNVLCVVRFCVPGTIYCNPHFGGDLSPIGTSDNYMA